MASHLHSEGGSTSTLWVSIGGCWGKSQSRPSTFKVSRFEPPAEEVLYSYAPKIQTIFSNNVTVIYRDIHTRKLQYNVKTQ